MTDFRFSLERIVDEEAASGRRSLLWVMLNPSTADDDTDDPTIRRVKDFTLRFGYTHCLVLNLWAIRATDPKVLARMTPEQRYEGQAQNNDLLGREFFARDEFVAAWGAQPWAEDRAEDVLALARGYDCQARALGVTSKGFPRHPLMMPADTQLRAYA